MRKIFIALALVAVIALSVTAGFFTAVYTASFVGWTDEDVYVIEYLGGLRSDSYIGDYTSTCE